MKKLNLNHDKTPEKLADINHQLESTLCKDELDDSKLRSLIELRDEVIISHLQSLDELHSKSFAKQEIKSNNALSKLISNQLNNSLTQLSGLLRGKKAVKKYK